MQAISSLAGNNQRQGRSYAGFHRTQKQQASKGRFLCSLCPILEAQPDLPVTVTLFSNGSDPNLPAHFRHSAKFGNEV